MDLSVQTPVSSDHKNSDVTVALVGQPASFSTGKVAGLGHSRFGNKNSGRYPLEVKKGQQYSADGRLVNKEQIIDRDNDRYLEEVVDATDGHVLRRVDEPLSRHVNHGSAKFKFKARNPQ